MVRSSGFVGGDKGSVGGGIIGDGAGESGSQEGGENDGLQHDVGLTVKLDNSNCVKNWRSSNKLKIGR